MTALGICLIAWFAFNIILRLVVAAADGVDSPGAMLIGLLIELSLIIAVVAVLF